MANNGLSTATGVTLVDTLPAEATFVSVDPDASCDEAGGTVTCDLGTIVPLEAVLVTIVVTAPVTPARMENTATASASSPPDPVPGNDASTAFTAVREPTCIFATLPPNDDGSTELVDIGFDLNFFGTTYSSLHVNNNGNVTFTGPLADFTPNPIVGAGLPIIAPYWGDVDTHGAGSTPVTYGQTPSGTRRRSASNGAAWAITRPMTTSSTTSSSC